MIRARMTPSTNGNGATLPVYQHVPSELREDISHILETEGMMETSAENRILTRMDGHHKETLSEIGEVREKIHGHDNRLVLVEDSVKRLEKSEATAGDERRNNGRMVKGAFAASIVGIIVSALVSVYGPSSRAVPEVKQDAAAISSQLTDLVKEIRQDRADRKAEQAAEQAAPANTSTPKTKARTDKRRPEPVPGPQINMLRPGELITTRDHEPPILSFTLPGLPIMRTPR